MRTSTSPSKTELTSRPMLVAALTLLVPGAGHMVLKLWSRAAVWAVGWFIVAATVGVHAWPLMALTLIAALDAFLCARNIADLGSAEAAEGPEQR
jgi:hypothetical protein